MRGEQGGVAADHTGALLRAESEMARAS